MHAHPHTCVRTRIRACMHIYVRACIYTCVQVLDHSSELIPILIRCQQLQKLLLEDDLRLARNLSTGTVFASAWNWVDAYLRIEHGSSSGLYRTLRQVSR